MKDIKSKIRIKDIAVLAGVSEGTVDRVLHQRGDVSAKSLEAVNKVLEEIDYTPNLMARSLASKKHYSFVCLFPDHQATDYWQSVNDGFDLAAEEFINFNVHIKKLLFSQYDAQTFIDTSNEILELNPDAVFIAPIFRNEALQFTSKLVELNIPFSYIDSMIEETNFVTYYGQNSFQSGYIAAKLLLNTSSTNGKILVIRTQRKGAMSNQTLNRNNGFTQYVQENKLTDKLELINVEFKDDDEVANFEVLRELFTIHSNIKAAITFNSKVYRLAMHLKTLNRLDMQLIGYDLLEENVYCLKNNMIAYLIAQRPGKQAYCTVRDMCKELIFKQPVSNINYVPIDILTKENIDYYSNFRE